MKRFRPHKAYIYSRVRLSVCFYESGVHPDRQTGGLTDQIKNFLALSFRDLIVHTDGEISAFMRTDIIRTDRQTHRRTWQDRPIKNMYTLWGRNRHTLWGQKRSICVLHSSDESSIP